MTTISLPVRTEFGFQRTVAADPSDILNCKCMPGMLVAADIERMAAPAGAADVLGWAKENLLASPGAIATQAGRVFRIRTLVPARQANGSCRFLDANDRCTIHADAPFGCAFVDSQMDRDDAELRVVAAMKSVMESWRRQDDGYADLWNILNAMGRVAPGPEVCRKAMDRVKQAEKEQGWQPKKS